MGAYENVIDLCKSYGIPQTILEKELGFSRGSIRSTDIGNRDIVDFEQILKNLVHSITSKFPT